MKQLTRAALLAIALGLGAEAQATVITNLPYANTPDWSDIIFSGTSMVNNGTSVTMTTAQNRGVWFGNRSGANAPAWSLGNAATGNYVSLTSSFSSNAADWSAYVNDGTYGAAFEFRPTGCIPGNCYSFTGQQGFNFYYRSTLDNSTQKSFVAMDLSVSNTFEMLLKNGTVSYRVNGNTLFTGAAYLTSDVGLLIGDGSGSSLSGVGSMTITGLTVDTAPLLASFPAPTSAPEPASWMLLMSGLALAVRRARS